MRYKSGSSTANDEHTTTTSEGVINDMLMRFDPFADFDRLSRQLMNQGGQKAFMPVDAYRQEDRFWLHVDLPGVDQDSIDLEVEKNTLTITAERKWENTDEMTILMSERPQGTFSRQFFLGEGLDADNIEAGYDAGVLTISIPVAEKAKPRKITIGATDRVLTS